AHESRTAAQRTAAAQDRRAEHPGTAGDDHDGAERALVAVARSLGARGDTFDADHRKDGISSAQRTRPTSRRSVLRTTGSPNSASASGTASQSPSARSSATTTG